MYADSGAKPIPGLGTGSPKQVADAVVKAIEQNKVEIAVAPLRQRVLAHFALASPGISVKIASGDAGQKAAASGRRRPARQALALADRPASGSRGAELACFHAHPTLTTVEWGQCRMRRTCLAP